MEKDGWKTDRRRVRKGPVSEAEMLERRQRGRNIREQQEDWTKKMEKSITYQDTSPLIASIFWQ